VTISTGINLIWGTGNKNVGFESTGINLSLGHWKYFEWLYILELTLVG
jgi:hypothetical protein